MTQFHYLISDDELWYKIHKCHEFRGGVYRLYSVNENGNPIAIPRLLGTDRKGILYIGRATHFLHRVIALKKCIDPNKTSSNHICGRRYKSHLGISKGFPYESLMVELLESEEPWIVEEAELLSYFEEFGEPPPLNRMG
jgi:hypothetical protein